MSTPFALLDPQGYALRQMAESAGIQLSPFGAAKTLVLAAATIVVRYKQVVASPAAVLSPLVLGSTDGNDAIYAEIRVNGTKVGRIDSFSGSNFAQTANLATVAIGAINQVAVTVTATRMDLAMNGGTAITIVLDGRPPGNPLTFVISASNFQTAIQSITLYDPLPDTSGLSELSEV